MENFGLIETMLWEEGSYFLLDLHLGRLKKSAEHFNFPYAEEFISGALESSSSDFNLLRQYKTRLLFDRAGKVNIASEILPEMPEETVRITFSKKKTDKTDIFLYHKTTKRSLYEEALNKYRAKGFFDVIFTNQEDEITEGAITNVMILEGENYWTPPLSCGVLAGVYRQHLINTQEVPLKEKVLRKEDLLKADKIYIMNSVRKMIPATIKL
jgi:para-aminobenzoate synthetase/4-amino-4-deoxychorismate lyase